MEPALEALQLDLDAGSPGAIGESHRVVEQDLVGADLDQRRRQAPEIGEHRRDARVGAPQVARVGRVPRLEEAPT